MFVPELVEVRPNDVNSIKDILGDIKSFQSSPEFFTQQLTHVFCRFIQQDSLLLGNEGPAAVADRLHKIVCEIREILIQQEDVKAYVEYCLDVFGVRIRRLP